METLTWPRRVRTGKVRAADAVGILDLQGELLPTGTGSVLAEQWSNGTVFARVDGWDRRVKADSIEWV